MRIRDIFEQPTPPTALQRPTPMGANTATPVLPQQNTAQQPTNAAQQQSQMVAALSQEKTARRKQIQDQITALQQEIADKQTAMKELQNQLNQVR